MKLYGLCLVKDEDDIIAQTLTYATRYCDKVFVLDNGSIDDTWHIVQGLAKGNNAVVPFERTLKPFSNRLRATVYNAAHKEFSEDDWWLILDSDEFLAEDPRPVIDIAVREGADIVKTWHIQFCFTERDLQAWEQRRDSRCIPIFERRRYYKINWQEARLFRNRPLSSWDPRVNEFVPDYLRRICRRRIFVRHYQFRDPEQIEKRLRLRYDLHVHHGHFPHVLSPDWRSEVADSRSLTYHEDGAPWQFRIPWLLYYYRQATIAKYHGARRRLTRLLARRGATRRSPASVDRESDRQSDARLGSGSSN